MFKKYIPFIILLAAAFAILYIKQHQRGKGPDPVAIHVTSSTSATTVSAEQDSAISDDPINRHPDKIIYSRHARCRMDCRHITETEIKEILSEGKINYGKIEENPKGKTYSFEGITAERQHLRVVFAPKGNNDIEVVTCIDLDTEWSCNCE
jgi:deoxycytidylate deaminase